MTVGPFRFQVPATATPAGFGLVREEEAIPMLEVPHSPAPRKNWVDDLADESTRSQRLNGQERREGYKLYLILNVGPDSDVSSKIFRDGRVYHLANARIMEDGMVSCKYSLERIPNATRK